MSAGLWYTRKVIARGRHAIEQKLSVADALSGHRRRASSLDIAGDFPRDAQAEELVTRWLAEDGIGDFAILNPGAGWGAKRWPAERYGQVAKELAKDGLCSLVNYGPGEEELAAAVEAASEGAARKISCSLSELIALTLRAPLLIAGDTQP